jgi:ubiquinone/menaquinone biosynthesis C-methylase UbiE
LAKLRDGESVLDLGSGSGTDTFLAALKVGPKGKVIGVDMTDEQRAKAERLRDKAAFNNVSYQKGYIDNLSCGGESVDVVISNGVINLSPDKAAVFREAARVLRPGGRLAICDIVTESQLPDTVSGDADLWAACIGGAVQEDDYRATIEAAGLEVARVEPCPYEFTSDNAKAATEKWGVKSIAVLAVKPG